MLGNKAWLTVHVAVPVKLLQTKRGKSFLYRPHFVHRGTVMLKQERAFLKLLSQSWKHVIV